MEIETLKQIKFFQSQVAAAFSDRDRALMETERSYEKEKAITDELEACALIGDPNEEIDPSLFDSEKNCARTPQNVKDCEMTARMMA